MEITRIGERVVEVRLEERQLLAMPFDQLRDRLPGLQDSALAFGRLALFFRSELPPVAQIEAALLSISQTERAPTKHNIPACYELGADLSFCADRLHISPVELIERHEASEFRVEAIGFAPGFPYLSGLDPVLCGLARRPSPRPRIPAGSIALAESLCGIYPDVLPGGWNLLAVTPVALLNRETESFRFSVGDLVRFQRLPLSHWPAAIPLPEVVH